MYRTDLRIYFPGYWNELAPTCLQPSGDRTVQDMGWQVLYKFTQYNAVLKFKKMRRFWRWIFLFDMYEKFKIAKFELSIKFLDKKKHFWKLISFPGKRSSLYIFSWENNVKFFAKFLWKNSHIFISKTTKFCTTFKRNWKFYLTSP